MRCQGSDDRPATRRLAPARECLSEILNRATGRRVAVFLHYDGTLTLREDSGRQPRIPPDGRRLLWRLAQVCHVTILSERDVPELCGLVGLPDVVCAGSLGFDVMTLERGLVSHPHALSFIPVLDGAEAALLERVSRVAGAAVLRHRFSIFIRVDEVQSDVMMEIDTIAANVLAGYPELRKRCRPGGLALEPNVDWDIGNAVTWLLTVLDLERADILPIYMGERTDEEAFAALGERGIGIVVGGEMRPTAAQYVLDGVHEVRHFLAALADARSAS